MFDASQVVDLHRLPELFCGFHRRPGGGPTLYPVACAPQAWAAGAVFMLLQACLGLHVNGTARQVSFISHAPAAGARVGPHHEPARRRRDGGPAAADDIRTTSASPCCAGRVMLKWSQ